tara:strand:- start:40458 stop:40664 length:207 start_codon:yes stop_codon:yes gene_type:complete
LRIGIANRKIRTAWKEINIKQKTRKTKQYDVKMKNIEMFIGQQIKERTLLTCLDKVSFSVLFLRNWTE